MAAISVSEYSMLQNHNSTATGQTGVQTSGGTSENPAMAVVLPMSGLVEVDSGSNHTVFSYARWNATTPTSYSFLDVNFTLVANPGHTEAYTESAVDCHITSYGNSYFNVTFPGGFKETLSPCTTAIPGLGGLTVRVSQHTHPQAGLLISVSTGDVYLLVTA